MRCHSLLFSLVTLIIATSLPAQSDLGTQGIRTVQVEIRARFLDTTSLRTTIELELRRIGLRVVAPKSGEPVDASIELYASASGMAGDGDAYHAVFARLSLWRRVYLHASPRATSVVAAVWQEDFLTSDSREQSTVSVREEVDRLSNDCLQANPHLATRSP